MRRAVFVLGPIVATAILYACDDSGSSSGGGMPEASAPFETGAAETAPPDASAGDADAEASVAPVTVHVARGVAPAANVTIVFNDAAGNVTETQTTGMDGKATSTKGAPAFASALLGAGNLRRILTWTAVEPGDDLFANDVGIAASEGSYS